MKNDILQLDKKFADDFWLLRKELFKELGEISESVSYTHLDVYKRQGVDGCDCEETLRLIAEGKINTEPLITHTYPLSRIEAVSYTHLDVYKRQD